MKKIYLAFRLSVAAFAALTACDGNRSTATPKSNSAVEAPTEKATGALTPNQQCAIDMCGPAERYLPTQAGGAFRTLVPIDVKTLLKEKMDPVLNDLADLAIKSRAERTDALDKIIHGSDFTNVSFSNSQLAVSALMSTISQVNNKFEKFADMSAGYVKVDAAKLTKAMPEWTEDHANKVAAALNLYFSNGSVRTGNNISSLSYDIFLQVMTKMNSSATPSMLGFVYGMLMDKAVKELGPFVVADLDLTLLNKMGTSPLTDREKNQVMRIISRTYSVTGFIDADVTKAFLDLDLPIVEIIKNGQMEEKLRSRRALLSSTDRLQKARVNIIEACHQNIVQALAAAPTGFRQRKAMELMERVKTASQKAAASYLSGVALIKASAAIDKVKFSQPPSLDDVKGGLQETLLAGKTQALHIESMVQNLQATNKDWQSFFMMSVIDTSATKDEDIFSSIQDLCKEFTPPSFVDKALASANLVQMGWQTATFPEIGAGVIAHEIGHIVSAEVAAETSTEITNYAATRECTMDIHKTLMPNQAGTAKATQFQEEDWADAFSATVLKELQKTWPYTKNFACALLSLNEENKSFGSLNLNSLNTSDTHSEDLLRALNTQMNLNLPVPSTCQPMLKAAMGDAPRACAK